MKEETAKLFLKLYVKYEWYKLDKIGQPVSGWNQVKGSWYLLKNDGAM